MMTPAYIRGSTAAAKHLGVTSKTLRAWQTDKTLRGFELLKPRVIHGRAYYSTEKLTRFMEPGREVTREFAALDEG